VWRRLALGFGKWLIRWAKISENKCERALGHCSLCHSEIMRVSHRRGAKRDSLNIRIKPEVQGLIDRAAELVGKNRTDFVLDAARHAAEDALLDCTVLAVSSKAYAEVPRISVFYLTGICGSGLASWTAATTPSRTRTALILEALST
jgi:uncharacterized protein (DUF1778 family)